MRIIPDDVKSIAALSENVIDGALLLDDPWSDRMVRQQAFAYKEEIYNRVLIKISNALNKQHGVDYSVRYWAIICGPWLRQFINRIYHFWSCVEKINNEKPYIFEVPNVNHKDFVPQDYRGFINIARTQLWNQIINGQIFARNGLVVNHAKYVQTAKEVPEDVSRKSAFKKIIEMLARSVRVLGKKEVVLISTGLDWFLKLKLMIKFREPLYFVDDKFKSPSFDYSKSLRKDFWQVLKSDISDSTKFETCLLDMVTFNLPRSYLEGYLATKTLACQCGFPKNPRVILASWTIENEVFKAYVASKIEDGTKLCILCHGGECHLYSDYHNHELEVCDRYYTWGWAGPSEKQFPGYRLRNSKKAKVTGDEPSLLLILTDIQCNIEYLSSVPSYEQYLKEYIADQIAFIGFLDPALSSILNVRLAETLFSVAKEKIEEKFPGLNFIYRNKPLAPFLASTRISILSYNQTSLAESMASGRPTVIFFRPESHEMNALSDAVYQALQSCGIFHNTPLSAAKHINSIWNDVNTWWRSPEVRQARAVYCDAFGRDSKTPVKHICEFIKF